MCFCVKKKSTLWPIYYILHFSTSQLFTAINTPVIPSEAPVILSPDVSGKDLVITYILHSIQNDNSLFSISPLSPLLLFFSLYFLSTLLLLARKFFVHNTCFTLSLWYLCRDSFSWFRQCFV